jgi:hypothetical protein
VSFIITFLEFNFWRNPIAIKIIASLTNRASLSYVNASSTIFCTCDYDRKHKIFMVMSQCLVIVNCEFSIGAMSSLKMGDGLID